MNRLKSFGAFWYDFVIGDDWHVAALGWSLHKATSGKSLPNRQLRRNN